MLSDNSLFVLDRLVLDPLVRLLLDVGILQEPPPVGALAGSTLLPIATLARAGYFSETDALQLIGQFVGLPFIDLHDTAVQATFTFDAFAGIASDMLFRARAIPLRIDPPYAVCAVANPLDFELIKMLEFCLGRPIIRVLAEERKIIHLLNKQFAPHAMGESSEDGGDYQHLDIVSSSIPEEIMTCDSVDTSQVILMCNKILVEAVRRGASDVHVEPETDSLFIRCRIDGIMITLYELSRKVQSNITSRLKLLSGMDIAERRRPQDGRFCFRFEDALHYVRASTVPTSFGETVVLRINSSEGKTLSLESIGFASGMRHRIEKRLTTRGKLILVTGPTGSGKTTTLYACLNYLRTGATTIITVEDPIEYRLAGIQQVQVNELIGVNFASALRSILRQDPDVIMIGEIRDAQTAAIAIQAAQTGHLVLSTLHTNSAPETVGRLTELGIQPFALANCLGGILAQRLVRSLCPECRRPAKKHSLKKHADLISVLSVKTDGIHEPVGCDACNKTGYRGRIPIASFLEASNGVVRAIQETSSPEIIIQSARLEGFQTLEEVAISILERGLTGIDEVRGYIDPSAPGMASRIEADGGDSRAKRRSVKKEASPQVSLDHMSSDQMSSDQTMTSQPIEVGSREETATHQRGQAAHPPSAHSLNRPDPVPGTFGHYGPPQAGMPHLTHQPPGAHPSNPSFPPPGGHTPGGHMVSYPWWGGPHHPAPHYHTVPQPGYPPSSYGHQVPPAPPYGQSMPGAPLYPGMSPYSYNHPGGVPGPMMGPTQGSSPAPYPHQPGAPLGPQGPHNTFGNYPPYAGAHNYPPPADPYAMPPSQTTPWSVPPGYSGYAPAHPGVMPPYAPPAPRTVSAAMPPVHAQPPTPPPEGQRPPASQAARCSGSDRPRILLVEDNPTRQKLLTRVLTKAMYDVTLAKDGEEALERASNEPFDLILCDLMLPKLSGQEVLTALRESEQTEAVPVVILTSSDLEDTEVELLDLGAQDFINKIASPRVILSRIKRLL